VVILRPGFVLGPGDLGRSSGATVLGHVAGKFPGYVDGGCSFCDVRDVARAHAEALERGRPGEVYFLGGHNLRMSEVARRVSSIVGERQPRRIPYLAAILGALAGETFALLGGRRWRLTVDFVRSTALYTFVTSEKARRELGYEVRPFEEMARDTLRWFLARGQLAATTPELRRLAAEGSPPLPEQRPPKRHRSAPNPVVAAAAPHAAT
jgi:dihydroflavonol-4-reductase